MRVGVVGSPHVNLNPNEWSTGEGLWGGVPDHSICSATVGLVKAFRKHGYDAFICHPTRSSDLQSAEALFVCEFNFLDRVLKSGFWNPDKPLVAWLHSPHPGTYSRRELASRCAGICFTRSEALKAFNASVGEGGCLRWVAPWAFPEWWPETPERNNPYDPNKLSLIFAGRSTPKGKVPALIESVSALGRNVEIHMFSNIGKHVAKNSEAAKVVAKYYKTPNVVFHGSWNHGTFLNYLFYADLALDTGGGVPEKTANNCKIWDYLAMGTPIISDCVAGGTELIDHTGCGIVGVPGSILDCISHSTGVLFPRKETMAYMREHHTWEAVVSRWLPFFDKAVS